jgi:hypothetical protein
MSKKGPPGWAVPGGRELPLWHRCYFQPTRSKIFCASGWFSP